MNKLLPDHSCSWNKIFSNLRTDWPKLYTYIYIYMKDFEQITECKQSLLQFYFGNKERDLLESIVVPVLQPWTSFQLQFYKTRCRKMYLRIWFAEIIYNCQCLFLWQNLGNLRFDISKCIWNRFVYHFFEIGHNILANFWPILEKNSPLIDCVDITTHKLCCLCCYYHS